MRTSMVVLDIVRDLLEANHWELADRYLAKQYIQHNPNVASVSSPSSTFREPYSDANAGSAARRPRWFRSPQNTIWSWWRSSSRIAIQTDPGRTYTTTRFDMWCIEDGKADEHWDPATIAAPPTPSGR